MGQVILQLAARRPSDWSFAAREVNGETAIVVQRADGTTDSVWILHVAENRIAAIDVVRNPAKLTGLVARVVGDGSEVR